MIGAQQHGNEFMMAPGSQHEHSSVRGCLGEFDPGASVTQETFERYGAAVGEHLVEQAVLGCLRIVPERGILQFDAGGVDLGDLPARHHPQTGPQ